MIKKQTLVALLLLLLIPVVMLSGGFLFSLINPELAAGHPNYVRNWHLLNSLKTGIIWAMFAAVFALYLTGSYLVIRSKSQSSLWLLLAALGPIGFAILSVLNDRAPSKSDRYSRFLRKLNWILRTAYEIACFFLIWELAWNLMLVKRYAMIKYQSITTGMTAAQIIAIQDASSGMYAFSEGLEIMFFVIVLYLLRPILFNLIARLLPSGPTLETS
ncbi:hypothetical protein [Occallatibacter savannae]|uniref:hypothetical protein n=1 Tax=Occallatibacter savannae TaxID=1002691 RepID=UPI000D68C3CD|nr:hypothetical protein [Occallatibacter savannae]